MGRIPHSPRAARAHAGQAGMTLVELMVGLVIGLLATLVITQVARVYEGQKRNTTAGADAQVNGAVALHTLQREIQMAGWGLSNSGAAGCATHYKLLSEPTGQFTLAPVEITDGASGAPDELTLRRGAGKGFAVPLKIKGHFRSASQFDLDGPSNVDIALGDLLLAVPRTYVPGPGGNWCVLFNVSAARDNAQPLVVQHQTGTNGRWNQDGSVNPDPSPGLPVYPGPLSTSVNFEAGSHLINLGRLEMARCRVDQQRLVTVRRTFSAASTSSAWPTWETAHPHIVDLQAVYGKDSTPTRDNVADEWNAIAPTTADGWSRVVAVRLAVVARSAHYEKDPVTVARPSAEDCALGPAEAGNYPVWSPAGDGTWECLTVDGLPDWQHYRYKIFETVVPLRNMLWQS